MKTTATQRAEKKLQRTAMRMEKKIERAAMRSEKKAARIEARAEARYEKEYRKLAKAAFKEAEYIEDYAMALLRNF